MCGYTFTHRGNTRKVEIRLRAVAGEVSGRPFGLKEPPWSEPGSKTDKINVKIKCIIFVYIPGTGV